MTDPLLSRERRAPADARRHPVANVALGLAAALLGLVVGGCNAYPQSIFQPKTEFADTLDVLFNIIFAGAVIVFVVVETVLIVAAIKHRARPGDPLPKQVHGNAKLEVAWTLAPAVVLAFILVPSTQKIFETQAAAPAGSLPIKVIGHQFWWEFEYPTLGVRTANEIHMPQGTTVDLQMTSADVIHSFWIPALGGKRDVLPGRENQLWWTAREPGVYFGQCAELCGYSHANMRMRGIVDTPQDFERWVAAQKAPAPQPAAGSDAARGAEIFQQRGCAGCHSINGTAAQGRTGPDLTRVGSRLTIAAGVLDNTPENLKRWIGNPTGVKPGALMPNLGLNDQELTQVAAYLTSLK